MGAEAFSVVSQNSARETARQRSAVIRHPYAAWHGGLPCVSGHSYPPWGARAFAGIHMSRSKPADEM